MSARTKIACISIDQLYNIFMQIRKGYKYRLKTNLYWRTVCPLCWGVSFRLEQGAGDQRAPLLAGVPRLSYAEPVQLVAWWKQSEEYGWLKEVHSQVLQQCLKDLERAYTNCFAGRAAPRATARSFSPTAFAIRKASNWRHARSLCP